MRYPHKKMECNTPLKMVIIVVFKKLPKQLRKKCRENNLFHRMQ